jgi:hypothetical protein
MDNFTQFVKYIFKINLDNSKIIRIFVTNKLNNKKQTHGKR